ncbi:hypothetical protein Thi970DRAFT_01288 [Thiorhodovibrio frisius]|uniref:Uncharacterized protein n=2 Tax=Thiorhodovibrio frisius TaxID=631362 RepID=H8YYT8_9GAMM|nr:hypothetical protein Thi970DRAFT_01288 [Thiorhodovibrio frisius]WPL23299.1 hypothetical protein Thiofri_03484 [Thiorhodovibrio frisius]
MGGVSGRSRQKYISGNFCMHNIAINIKDDQLAKQVVWWLEHFKDDGLEIVSVEDLDDLKALHATRHEASVAFEDYLAHAD